MSALATIRCRSMVRQSDRQEVMRGKRGMAGPEGGGAARNLECYGEQNMCCGVPHCKSSKPKRRDKTRLGQRRGRKRRAGNEGLGAEDERGNSSAAGSGRRQGKGKRALSPRGEGQGREVRVLLGQGVPLVPPQGSTHLRRSLPSLRSPRALGPNYNNVRVPKAYGDQSIHASTKETFVPTAPTCQTIP